jgi:pimeloyl-ACP methyl ester carboxylesterase
MRRLSLLCIVVASPAFAQFDRYEVGRRIHDFEVVWEEKANDKEARKRAAPLVNQTGQSFLKLKVSEAAQSLDAARHALLSTEPASAAVRWADALQIVPEARAVDATTEELSVTLKPFYKVDVKAPNGAIARAKLGAGKPVEVAIDKLPATIQVPVKSAPGTPSADFPLVVEIVADGQTLARKETKVARIEKFAERLAAVKKASEDVPSSPKTIEQASFLLLVKLLEDAANKKSLETDYPTSRLMFGAERLAKVKEPYYIASRPGEFWLSIPTGKKPTVVRIRIPPKLEEKKTPVPIIFALHGRAGSENLFFDGYGIGMTPRLAAERGWIIVSPHADGGLLGSGPAPDVPAILDELIKRYPIDPKRVYLIGHSMGAGHALDLAQKEPSRYAGIALLGGSGKITKRDALKSLPVFAGCGKLDPALDNVRSFEKDLADAGAKVSTHEYDDIEHMLIVREAAADVFKFFDGK